MRSYKQIRADIARLEREAEAARKKESGAVAARVRKLIEAHGLTAEDLGLAMARPASSLSAGPVPTRRNPRAAKKAAGRTRSSAGVAKYREPQSGKTWTGFGRAPAWLAGVKDREAFRIGAGEARSGGATAVPKAAASRKAPPARRGTSAKTPAEAKAAGGAAGGRPAKRAAAGRAHAAVSDAATPE